MTVTKQEIRSTVDRYLERYPQESGGVDVLLHALATGARVTSRKEFNGGHVTCGAVVTDRDGSLLLIRHKALNTWLLPGGHLEPEDADLLGAALRELREETAISWDGTASSLDREVPIDIDVHSIPANPAKGEPAHWHADFRFAFQVERADVEVQLEEVDGYAWRPVTDAPTPELVQKLSDLLA